MNTGRETPPTLEDLLRLKRAEAPSKEFWTRFEHELRGKQLAAIVEKRPWWCAFPRGYVFVLRHKVQLGSVAALSLAFTVSYREYRTYELTLPRAAAGEVDYAVASSARVAPDAVAIPVERAAVAVNSNAASDSTPSTVAASDPLQTMESADSRLEAGLAFRPSASSARLIAANLALAQAAALGGGLSNFQPNFAPQPASVNAPIEEPLAQMTTPSDERRARLMAGALPAMAPSGALPAHMSERLVSRLSDDRLYESMSRYGVDGGGVSIKF